MKTLTQILCACLTCFTFSFISAQTPILNSYPAGDAVVFLDLDGHTVTGTSWNWSGPIVCDGSNLNATQITDIFNRVAEDYRPFTINVTTDSTKYWAAPAAKRMRVILTTTSSWYGPAGGVAYVNSFNWGDNTPCFVFTALLGYNSKNIAEAVSHEAGHTLGLRHQSSYDAVCNKTAEYNPGTGSGEIGWAPIMGVGYYRNMTLWNYGANPFGCTSFQDDLSIITGSWNNGVNFRTDDHGNTATTATEAIMTSNYFAENGVIEKPGDTDVVKFTLPLTGRFQLYAEPYSIATGNTGANLDLKVELLDDGQNSIGVYNPSTSMAAFIDVQLPAGTFYLRVQGEGNAYAPNYAVLGSYKLTGMLSPGNVLGVHKLQLKGVAEKGTHKLDWEIIADERVADQVIEVSTNGRTFQSVSSVNSTARNYAYSPQNGSIFYYRVNATFSNGRRYYSNIVALHNNGANNKPYLIGNAVKENMVISSPTICEYAIYDMSGRSVTKGRLLQGVNTFLMGNAAAGLYVIQYNMAGEAYTEKFRKE